MDSCDICLLENLAWIDCFTLFIENGSSAACVSHYLWEAYRMMTKEIMPLDSHRLGGFGQRLQMEQGADLMTCIQLSLQVL